MTCVFFGLLVFAEPSVTSSLQSLRGGERSLSLWTWGVAGLIIPSSCSALHLLTCRMTPADLSLAQTPSITPPDAHPHTWGAPEEENLTARLYHSAVIQCSGSWSRTTEMTMIRAEAPLDKITRCPSETTINSQLSISAKRRALFALHSHSTSI